MYRRRPRPLVTIGLVFVPTTLAIAAIAAIASRLPVFRWIVDLADDVSEARMVLGLLIGILASAIPYVAVNAMVAAYYHRSVESTSQPGALDALRYAWARRRPIAIGFARAVLVVLPLALTIVGLPWALRQLVRYQFMPQVVVLEGLDGRTALARSSALVRGRWWHTAWMVMIFNMLIVGSGFVIGLLLLVVLAGLPFWLFSALIALVYALIVPLAAVAQTLLYGDAAAESEEAVDGDAVPATNRSASAITAT
jgi:hypothetical protein